jgi:inhibitor of KinA sporulation pathway (predicted exonuclease)
MDANTHYISLDLELNNSPDGSTPNPKIIEIGVAIGSWDSYSEQTIISKNWLIDPKEPIYPFITQLTGITDQEIAQKAVSPQTVANELAQLIKTHNAFVNPVVWGVGDSQKLKSFFKDHNIHFPFFGRRDIDIKTWYVMHMITKSRKPNGGLKSALSEYKMTFNGKQHRAADDAKNTLQLFFKILDTQDHLYQIIKNTQKINI